MIYTSYFAKAKSLEDKFIVVGITRYPPKWFNGKNFEYLAPTSNLLMKYKNGEISEEMFEVQYRTMLKNIKPYLESMVDRLKLYNTSLDKHVVLCCYEKSDDFCHRHLLANELKEEYELDIKEWK